MKTEPKQVNIKCAILKQFKTGDDVWFDLVATLIPTKETHEEIPVPERQRLWTVSPRQRPPRNRTGAPQRYSNSQAAQSSHCSHFVLGDLATKSATATNIVAVKPLTRMLSDANWEVCWYRVGKIVLPHDG